MSFDYDVTIVGAGPIGSTLAFLLSQNNVKVCIIDKKRVIGLPLQCAGIVNKKILDFISVPQDLILNEVNGAFLHSKNCSFSVSKEETQAYVIDRVAFDQFLFNRAINSGVDSFLSSKVIDVNSKSGVVKFKCGLESKLIKSKLIVGADGPNSIVSFNMHNNLKYYSASQYLVKVDNIDNMAFVDVYASEDLFPGFIWVIPVYKNIFRIGLFSNHDYKEQSIILDNFLSNDFKFDDFKVIEKYKGKIPIYDKNNNLTDYRSLLVGDAASQVKPTTGGGLLVGFESVIIAKEIILNVLNNKILSYEDYIVDSFDSNTSDGTFNDSKYLDELYHLLDDYQKEFDKRFSKEFSYQNKVQQTLCTLSNHDLDYFFSKLKESGADLLISKYGDMDNQSILVKEFIKRGLIFSLLPTIHKRKLAKIWLL